MKKAVFYIKDGDFGVLESINTQVNPQISLVFANRYFLEEQSNVERLNKAIPGDVVYVSGAGQICQDSIYNEQATICSIELERSRTKTASVNIDGPMSTEELGMDLYQQLDAPDLKGIMVFSDGMEINGSNLKNGLERFNSRSIPITGGLAGDGARFEKTLTGLNDASIGNIVALGFYGEYIELGFGSRGGWVQDVQQNIVSSSDGNVLKEINGVPALHIYKQKWNGKLQNMPSDALKYPLMISDPFSSQVLVRTVLHVDEEEQTMTFAGDMPLASGVRFLSATNENLIRGAKAAASFARERIKDKDPELAILVSCVGRKLVMKEEAVQEVLGVKESLGSNTDLVGFYSYGELCPSDVSGECELLNQTMTITTIKEKMD